MIILRKSQAQMVTFVLVDANCNEMAGLAGTFTVQVSKAGGALAASAGAKGEIGSGWYHYTLTATETNTDGPVSLVVTGAGVIQQNLVYFVRGASIGCVDYTYTVTSSATGAPMEGVEIWVTTDAAGTNVVWYGITDALGVARDSNDEVPCLDAGQYFFWKQHVGFTDDQNPDIENVS